MCPPGCHHTGFMAAPELGHRMYGYTLCRKIVLKSQQRSQTVNTELCIVQIVNIYFY